MTTPKESARTRDAILKLLSDEEVAKVSAAETRRPVEGDRYVDLEHPENGVLQVHAEAPPRWTNILAESSVREETWSAILALVGV